MRTWHLLLDSIDSNGGHVFILLLLMIFGVTMMRFGMMQGEAVVTGAFGAILFKMKDSGSNLDANIKEARDLNGVKTAANVKLVEAKVEGQV